MRSLKAKPTGELFPRDLRYFGGEYSLFEKFMLRGVGSPRLIYLDGEDEFDAVDRDVPGETPFVNFELLKNGLIARLNQNNRTATPIGWKLDEIELINLKGYSVEIKVETIRGYKTKVVHRGELEITSEGKTILLNVLTKDFKGTVRFFNRPVIGTTFTHSISKSKPEVDHESRFLALLGWAY